MTQRSIPGGSGRTVIIKAGGSVSVKGHASEMVTAETKGRWGLTLERRSESQIGRARAAIGEHVLFDVRMKLPNLREKKEDREVVEVQMGGSGEVLVPFASSLKIYAGKDIDARNIGGQVDAYAGLNLHLQDVYCLGNGSAGWTMDVDCQTMVGDDVTFAAGGDLSFHIADLTSVRLRVKDLDGYWEARIGRAEKSVYLKSGGDVTFVTDQKVEALPPNYILGRIEEPRPRQTQ
ncbi:MAG TPA: hypothetical protein VLZ89_05155 [Anaerolineales bacterium]|nr:hypothetical protein [Anaerolineales bacterium]